MADLDNNTQRVFKKSSPNGKVTLYLTTRDLILHNNSIDKVCGVVHVEPDFMENKKLYGQVTLTFRYGREDEEVMGLKFCNEAVMSLAQIWPPHPAQVNETTTTALQDALLRRLGHNAHPFQMELTPLAPPSVQLVPAKQYHGAPIGTSYDVRAYVADRADEKVSRRGLVRMGIRVIQGCSKYNHKYSGTTKMPHLHGSLTSSPEHNTNSAGDRITKMNQTEDSERYFDKNVKFEDPDAEPPPPHVTVDKPFLLSDGKVELEAWLDKAVYSHGESIKVSLVVTNNSQKTVRRIKIMVVQHVDVCMFSNGKFKNIVALERASTIPPVLPGRTLSETFSLTPHKGVTKNWIALEDSYSKSGASLASTIPCNTMQPEDRNVFAIYVTYYAKVKLTLTAMGGELSLKLPFTLVHSCGLEPIGDSCYEELVPTLSDIKQQQQEEKKSHHHTVMAEVIVNTIDETFKKQCDIEQRSVSKNERIEDPEHFDSIVCLNEEPSS